MIPVFDGHNDLLLRLYNAPDRREEIWLTGEGKGHLDLPRMRKGGFAGGFFAVYIPSPVAHDAPDYMAAMENPPFALPLPDLDRVLDGIDRVMGRPNALDSVDALAAPQTAEQFLAEHAAGKGAR